MVEATEHDIREWVLDCVAQSGGVRLWPIHILACLAAHECGGMVSRDLLRKHLEANGYDVFRHRTRCHEVVRCSLVYPDGRFRK